MLCKIIWISMAGCALLLGSGCATGIPGPGPMPPGQTFVGDWDSNWGLMKLMQNGKRVFGPFKGFRNGSISGEQEGDLIRFHWFQREASQSGHGYLRISQDGQSLEGRWGYMKSYDNGGRWNATRTAGSQSESEP